MEATFYFDPVCPWSWRASRWLVQAAPARGLALRWRAFSLSILNDGPPAEHSPAEMAASGRALRLVEALAARGRHDDAGRFYTGLGTRAHEAGAELSDKIVEAAAASVPDLAGALDDPAWDAAVRRAHEDAYGGAGPDVGSPVLTVEGAERGLHGPILARVPSPEESLAIWDGLLPLLRTPVFFEAKRGRTTRVH